jgi:hypothetical protein
MIPAAIEKRNEVFITDHGSSRDSRNRAFRVRRAVPALARAAVAGRTDEAAAAEAATPPGTAPGFTGGTATGLGTPGTAPWLGTRSGSIVSPTRESGGEATCFGAAVGLGERTAAPVAPVADELEVAALAATVPAEPAAPGLSRVDPTCPPGFSRAEPCDPASSLAAGTVGEVRVGGDPAEIGESALDRESGTPAGGSAVSAFLPKPQRSRRDRLVGASVGASQTGTLGCCPPRATGWPEAGAAP